MTLREELIEIASLEAYDLLVAHLMELEVAARTGTQMTFLPHPAVRRRGASTT